VPPRRCDWSKPRRASKVVLKKEPVPCAPAFFVDELTGELRIPREAHDGEALLGTCSVPARDIVRGAARRLSSADPVAIAVWRLGFSLLIVAVFLVVTREWRDWSRISSRELALAAAAGVSLALHFWAWNASIHLTTIAASVTLVNLQPAVVAVISAVALKEAPTGRQIIESESRFLERWLSQLPT